MSLYRLIIVLVFFYSISFLLVVHSDHSNYLVVPQSVFLSSLSSITEQVKAVKGQASILTNEVNNFRLSTAISDCLELLDDTIHELIATQSIIENPNVDGMKTGNPSSDMETWLSDAIVNQDACIKGIESSHSYGKSIIVEKLQQIRWHIKNILGMVGQIPSSNCSVFVERAEFPSRVNANVVVDNDGSGNYTTIMDAVSNAPNNSKTMYVIHVKEGVYEERVVIDKKKRNLVMIGDGMNKTVISFNRSVKGGGYKTNETATLDVLGWGFMALDMKIDNTAGAAMEQAVALRSKSDLSIFYRLDITGHQDTLYAHSLRQFYKECRISGTVDFIFGHGKAMFQNCSIIVRKSLPNKINTITAQGQDSPEGNSAFSFQFCSISADEELISSNYSNPTYLGRPWKTYSTTVFMQSNLSNFIMPQGWTPWNETMPGSDTIFYGEYMNYGDGSSVDKRVNWRGFHLLNKAQARNFTVAQLIDGNCWLPVRGIEYRDSL